MSVHDLVISEVSGDFAVDTEVLGRQDPYIYFSVGKTKIETPKVKGVGARTAHWKETFTLRGFNPAETTLLFCDVVNSNFMRPDNNIGSGFIDMATLQPFQLTGKHAKVVVPLADKKNTYMGSLSFLLNATGYMGKGGQQASHGSGHTTREIGGDALEADFAHKAAVSETPRGKHGSPRGSPTVRFGYPEAHHAAAAEAKPHGKHGRTSSSSSSSSQHD